MLDTIYEKKFIEEEITTYYEKNKERIKKYYEENKDEIKVKRKIYYEKNIEKKAICSRNYYRKFYKKCRLQALQYRAKIKNIPFDLKEDDINIPKLCPVLKIPLIKFDQFKNKPSIDRIDNTKGYTKENIIVMSFAANSLKNDMPLAVWKEVLKRCLNKTEEEINIITNRGQKYE